MPLSKVISMISAIDKISIHDGQGSVNPLSKTLRECPVCHYVNTDLEKSYQILK